MDKYVLRTHESHDPTAVDHRKFIHENWHHKLYVIVMIANVARYDIRYHLYREFEARMRAQGARLFTVEIALRHRSFAITSACNPMHLQIRTDHWLWHKEAAMNAALRHLPCDWEYCAFIDADLVFINDFWIDHTLHALQTHPVVQPWVEAIDVNANYEPFMRHKSFAWCYANGVKREEVFDYYGHEEEAFLGHLWHPGFAIAFRRKAIELMGGLPDWHILGGGDNMLMKCLIGDGQYAYPKDIQPSYKQRVLGYQERALEVCRKDLGYVHGLIISHWHGNKKSRGYWDRWKILVRNKFDVNQDIFREVNGLWSLADNNEPRQWQLRNDIRTYFLNREEDSTEFHPEEGNM